MNVRSCSGVFVGLMLLASIVAGQERAVVSEVASSVPAERIRAYGDERNVSVEDEWETFLEENEELIGSVAPKPVSFAAAITKAQALAKQVAEAKAVMALRAKLPEGDDVAAYRLLAVREAVRGSFEAVLCFLVAAYGSDPQNADTLNDLAGVLASLGYANEALAILDELAKRGALPAPPMGISGEDAMDYVRGYCLARVGDNTGARAKLEAVAARQPLLAEVSKMLALIDEQEGKNPRKNFLLGVWRHRAQVALCAGVERGEAEPDAFAEGEEVAIDLRSLLDLSKGKVGKLPNVPYAATAEQANGLEKKLEAVEATEDDVLRAIKEKQGTVKPRRYVHTEADVQETWGYRMHTLLTSLDRRDKRLRELNQAIHETIREVDTALRKIVDERDKAAGDAVLRVAQAAVKAKKQPPSFREMGEIAKPFHDAALGQAHGLILKKDKAVRDRFAEWHLLATALAGEVGDARWREYFRLSIEAERSHVFSQLIHCSEQHARVGAHPYLEIPHAADPGAKEEQGMGSCDSSQSAGVSINSLGFGEVVPFDLGVEVTCEGISLEAGVSVLPGLQLSGEIGVDTKGGYSVFVGPKIDATIKGTGVTVKQGFIVAGSRDGSISEVAAKMETKRSVSVGAVSQSAKISDLSMSFMPGPRSGPPADLQPIGTK